MTQEKKKRWKNELKTICFAVWGDIIKILNVSKPEHWLVFQIPKLYSAKNMDSEADVIQNKRILYSKWQNAELTIPSDSDRKY